MDDSERAAELERIADGLRHYARILRGEVLDLTGRGCWRILCDQLGQAMDCAVITQEQYTEFVRLASERRTSTMPGIVLDGNNSFHSGWLAAFFGMPREPAWLRAVKDDYRSAWQEGYDTQRETGSDKDCLAALRAMVRAGQVSVEWEE